MLQVEEEMSTVGCKVQMQTLMMETEVLMEMVHVIPQSRACL